MRVGPEVQRLAGDLFSPFSDHTQLVAQILASRAGGDRKGAERLTSVLIQRLEPLLRRAANRFERRRGSLSVDDLMQVGRIEVVKAIDSFDAARSKTFATLVWWQARRAMNDEIRLRAADVRPSAGAQKKRTGDLRVIIDNADAYDDEDPEPLADVQIEAEQARVLLLKLLHRLPRHMADLVRKVHGLGGVEPMSLRDVAKTTGQNRMKLAAELKRAERLIGVMMLREHRTH